MHHDESENRRNQILSLNEAMVTIGIIGTGDPRACSDQFIQEIPGPAQKEMATIQGDVLQHVTFASHVDVGMWADLATAKLHSMRLSSEPAAIWGCYGPSLISRNRASAASTVPMFCIERDALDPNGTVPAHQAIARGTVSVVRTLLLQMAPGRHAEILSSSAFQRSSDRECRVKGERNMSMRCMLTGWNGTRFHRLFHGPVCASM